MSTCRSPEYNVWLSIRARCLNPNHPSYAPEGMCKEWAASFAEFLKNMGPRPSPKHRLTRTNKNKSFNPWNCNWLLPDYPLPRPPRSDSPKYEYEGESKTLLEWSRDPRCKVTLRTLRSRVTELKWPISKAIKRVKRGTVDKREYLTDLEGNVVGVING